MVMTNKRLKKFFPKYHAEIEKLEGTLACGCSLCVWRVLHEHHPELKLPKSVEKYEPWG